ncbi:hypothetical protein QWJ90_05010 [Microbacterium oryzae]|uniref:hypothetical protein n=1 Tax=Microbacterium oryzae TaxID=743009 RepID=UPI0025AEF901|nr:hypothetical protein [Microbacterium oryzae]MDN3310281.1 hypothetical protein [Microbacterium oryzae]
MTAGGENPGAALWMAAAVLGVIAIVVAFIFWRAKRSGSRSAVLDVVLILSSWFVVISMFVLALQVITTFSSSWIEFSTSSVGPYSMPTGCFSGTADRPVEPTLACLSYDHARATVSSPAAWMRWIVVGTQVLSTAALLTPFVIVAISSFQAAAGRPFHALTTRSMYIGAVVVAVTGLGSDVLSSIGQTAILRGLIGRGDAGYPEFFYVQSTLWPLGAALLLAALAAIFRHGAQLQRDTEGLV